jgi:hypothetical protein
MNNNYPDNFVLEDSDRESCAREDEQPALGLRRSSKKSTIKPTNDIEIIGSVSPSD